VACKVQPLEGHGDVIFARSRKEDTINGASRDGPWPSGKIQTDAQGFFNGATESLIRDRSDLLDESAFVNSADLVGQDE
jgi:hypothetical protein